MLVRSLAASERSSATSVPVLKALASALHSFEWVVWTKYMWTTMLQPSKARKVDSPIAPEQKRNIVPYPSISTNQGVFLFLIDGFSLQT